MEKETKRELRGKKEDKEIEGKTREKWRWNKNLAKDKNKNSYPQFQFHACRLFCIWWLITNLLQWVWYSMPRKAKSLAWSHTARWEKSGFESKHIWLPRAHSCLSFTEAPRGCSLNNLTKQKAKAAQQFSRKVITGIWKMEWKQHNEVHPVLH